MKKAVLGSLFGLLVLGLMAGGSGVRQLHKEINAIQQQWLVLKASPPDRSTVAEARALWQHTHALERRYADNPRVKTWEDRTWSIYRSYLERSDWAS